MPTYEYRCAKCEQHLDVFQSFSEAPLTRHRGCGGKLMKVLSPAGIVLKGSGFYKTDSRSSQKRSTKPAETTPAETTPETTKSTGKTERETGRSERETGRSEPASTTSAEAKSA